MTNPKQVEKLMNGLEGVCTPDCRNFCSHPVSELSKQRALAQINNIIEEEIRLAESKAVLDYILSLGWQDTSNRYVAEVIADADRIAEEYHEQRANLNKVVE